MTPPPAVVHSVGDAGVIQEPCGPASLLRFSGKSTPELVAWLKGTLREARQPTALHLRDLAGIEGDFVQEVLKAAREGIRRRRPVALIEPPGRVVEALEQMGASDLVPVLSCESALREAGSIPDAVLKDHAALADLLSRTEINPLWRKLDQESTWVCPFCGGEAAEVRVRGKPSPPALRAMRAHLLEQCLGWRAGRRDPYPATVMDSFLLEINKRKSAAEDERRWRLSQEMETLNRRVDSMEDLERSVAEAKRKQLHMLPVDPAPDPIADIAVVYRPLQSVSGDFLDFYEMEDNRFGLTIGDVSGHGVETAIIMGMAKMALRVRSQGLGTVKELMAAANRDLFTELRRAAFVTGLFAVIDRDTRVMTYARMGHTKPLVRRAAGGCEELEAQGLPFGVDSGTRFVAGLEEREEQLEQGDVVLLYTDGVIEAGPPTGQFGLDRLKEALLAAPSEGPARAFLDSIVQAMDDFLAGEPAGDDVTLICLKIK
jgi:serine phosphatase RsbU (regulator of sigma subunit)